MTKLKVFGVQGWTLVYCGVLLLYIHDFWPFVLRRWFPIAMATFALAVVGQLMAHSPQAPTLARVFALLAIFDDLCDLQQCIDQPLTTLMGGFWPTVEWQFQFDPRFRIVALADMLMVPFWLFWIFFFTFSRWVRNTY